MKICHFVGYKIPCYATNETIQRYGIVIRGENYGGLGTFICYSFLSTFTIFVLDEIDAALDNANVARIGNYIKKYAGPNFQFIVISLKNSLFEKSDALVGIYREQRKQFQDCNFGS